jgi:HK97 family phage portal protein
MPVIKTFDGFQSVGAGASASSGGGSVNLSGLSHTYAKIYRTQPNVRICVDFLARNVAQLGIHAYKRVSDTDRQRLYGLDVIRWLNKPNPGTTRYRLIESLMSDLGIYFNAYWLKVRVPGRLGFVRLPPEEVDVKGDLLPSAYVWTHDSKELTFAPSEIVHFNGYNPTNSKTGLSPMETLRQILAEEFAAVQFRRNLWKNAARRDGVIEVAPNGPQYGPEQLRAYREQWQEALTGPEGSGKTGLLPKGMTFKESQFSAKDSEYVTGSKLRREVCAAAYHIPQPMVGILEHATFSNIKEQHKHTYQDSLAPWLVMIVAEFDRQILDESEDDVEDVYFEFNINAKLAGSFEEQASSIQSLTGRPVMTGNEGRARLNLPRVEQPDMDRVALPLNTGAGESDTNDKPGIKRTPPPASDSNPDDEDEDAADA